MSGVVVPARIDPQPWMTEPAVSRLLKAFADGRVEVRFVGGCVRNALLGVPVADVDLATPAKPSEVTELLAAAGIRVVPTGLEHGTVTAVVDGKTFEITTLRRDVKTDGRHAVVAFTDDWSDDAARRDFTINAIFCAADGTLYDPIAGLPDISARRVRFVGEARQRIREDVLRLLRFFRFHAHYGKPPPDPNALDACAELAPLLPSLSGERVRDELMKLLLAADPAVVWRLMLDRGIIGFLIPAATRVDRLARLTRLEGAFGLVNWLRRLAALLPTDRETALHVAEQLRLSNEQRDRLAALASANAIVETAGPTIRRALYRLGPGLTVDLALLQSAEREEVEDRVEPVLKAASGWTRPCLPLNGGDVIALGISPGPRIGELLRAVEAWWIDRDFAPGRDECLRELRLRAS